MQSPTMAHGQPLREKRESLLRPLLSQRLFSPTWSPFTAAATSRGLGRRDCKRGTDATPATGGTPTFTQGPELASRRATATIGSQVARLRTNYWRADEGSHNRALWVTRRDRGTRRPRAGARTG